MSNENALQNLDSDSQLDGIEELSSSELLAEAAGVMRRQRLRALSERFRKTRTLADHAELVDQHIAGVLTDADIIKEAAIAKIVKNKEDVMSAAGLERDVELQAKSLKALSDVVREQSASQSLVLGLPGRISVASQTQTSTSATQISGTVIVQPASKKPALPVSMMDDATEGEVIESQNASAESEDTQGDG
jgi:uncharacterized coiled-coil protein SlyX